jgi:tRNA(fMet)-specific endonuclease VapC
MDLFMEFASQNNIIPLTTESTKISAKIYADLRKKGTPVDDIDLLIAGIALENNFIMVTNNISHFERIEKLKIENWSFKKFY